MKLKKFFWGIFFVFAAVSVIANSLGHFNNISLLSLFATILLFAIIIECTVKGEFFGIFFPLAVIAIIFSKPLGITSVTPWPVLIAALFLSIGFSILFKHPFFRFRKYKNHVISIKDSIGDDFKHFSSNSHNSSFQKSVDDLDSDIVDCYASFSACTKYLHSTNLQKVIIKCNCGAVKVYFDNAQMHPDGTSVELDSNLSGVELYIPKTWKVLNNISAFMGGVEEKNKHSSSDGPALILNGNIRLSGIEIIYV